MTSKTPPPPNNDPKRWVEIAKPLSDRQRCCIVDHLYVPLLHVLALGGLIRVRRFQNGAQRWKLLPTIWSIICVGLLVLFMVEILFLSPHKFRLDFVTIFRLVLASWTVKAVISIISFHFACTKFAEFNAAIRRPQLLSFETKVWGRIQLKPLSTFMWYVITLIAILVLINSITMCLHLTDNIAFPAKVGVFWNVDSRAWLIPLYAAQVSICMVATFGCAGLQGAMLALPREMLKSFVSDIGGIKWTLAEIRQKQTQLQDVYNLIEFVNDIWSFPNIVMNCVTTITIVGTISVTAIGTKDMSWFIVSLFIGWLLMAVKLYLMLHVSGIRLNEMCAEMPQKIKKSFIEARKQMKCIDDEKQGKIHIEFMMLVQLAAEENTNISAGNAYPLARMSLLTTSSVVVTYLILILQFAQ